MSESRRDQHGEVITTAADRCVKCGLCLPHCPTYALTRDESESPRGRIALAEALARGDLPPAGKLFGHLDRCLLCRACERACPSGVSFGQLMDHARALTLDQQPRWVRTLASALSHGGLVRAGLMLSRVLPAHWSPGGPALSHAARRLAGNRRRYPRVTARAKPSRRVGLFLGCVGDAVQPGVADAARQLLRAAGVQVVTPHAQTCCGALQAHLGNTAAGSQRGQRNHDAFADQSLDAIISLASGCGAQLAEQSPALPAPHLDAVQYLVASGLIDRLVFAPLAGTALVHTPCTLQQHPAAARAVGEALARIPELQVLALTAGSACCGAGGLQLLTRPEQGAALRAPKIAAIRKQAPDWLITSNVGCALHLAAGLDDPALVPLHPLELLAQQLQPAGAG